MESSYEIHCSIASYANVLHSHILKTDEQISSLKSNINSFALAQNIADPIAEKVDESGALQQDAEDAVIAALERERLDLIMEIQEQDFAQEKLKAMVSESSELIHAVSQFYKDLHANGGSEQDASQQEGNSSQPTLSHETEQLIRANISELRNVLSKLRDSIKQSASQTQIEFFESADAQEKLSSLVDSLNEGFKLLSTGT